MRNEVKATRANDEVLLLLLLDDMVGVAKALQWDEACTPRRCYSAR